MEEYPEYGIEPLLKKKLELLLREHRKAVA